MWINDCSVLVYLVAYIMQADLCCQEVNIAQHVTCNVDEVATDCKYASVSHMMYDSYQQTTEWHLV